MSGCLCPTQSVPARVDKANWNGAQLDSTCSKNCLANGIPVTMPRTPPFLQNGHRCKHESAEIALRNVSPGEIFSRCCEEQEALVVLNKNSQHLVGTTSKSN